MYRTAVKNIGKITGIIFFVGAWLGLTLFEGVGGNFEKLQPQAFINLTMLFIIGSKLYLLALPILIFLLAQQCIKKNYARVTLVAICLLLVSLLYYLDITFILYKIAKHYSFDFFYFWYNRGVAVETIWFTFSHTLVISLIISMFILAGIWFLTGRAILTHKIHTKKWLGVSAVIFIGSIALQIFGAGFYKTEMTTAIQHAFTRDNKIG